MIDRASSTLLSLAPCTHGAHLRAAHCLAFTVADLNKISHLCSGLCSCVRGGGAGVNGCSGVFLCSLCSGGVLQWCSAVFGFLY